MTTMQKSTLEFELGELFEIRSKRVKEKKLLQEEALEVKKDIKLLTIMFSQGISDLYVMLNETEILEWDSRTKRLVYQKGEFAQYIEAVSNDILIRIRPFLKELVRKAKDSYK